MVFAAARVLAALAQLSPHAGKQLTKRAKGFLFLAVGLGLGATAIGIGIARAAFLRHALTAPGVVTRLNAGGSHPEIEFTVAGRKVDYPQGGFIFGYRPGEPVEVLYNPDNPADACIREMGALWFASALTALLAALFIGAGLGLARKPQ